MPNRVKVFPIKTEEEPTTAAEYKSVELSPALENIPVTKRSCTDAIWCFTFLFVFGALIACGVYTFITGEFKYVGRVYDSDGKLCGIDSGYEDYSYLYYPIPGIKYTTQTVCIKTCPVSPLASSLVGLYKTNSLFTNTIATANDPTVIATSLSSGSSLSGNFYMYDTLTFADQLCMPQKFGTTFTPLSNELVALDIFGQWMGDLRKTWDVIAVAIGIAVLAGLIFTSLMTCQSGVLFIIGLLLTLASLAGSGWMLSTKEDTTQSAIADTTDEISSESIISKNNLAKVVIGFTFWGIACLVYLSLLLFYKKLLMANNLMKAAAADYIRKTWTVFLFATFMALVLFIFFAFWTMGVYCLVGFGDITSIKAIPFGSALFDMKARYLFIFFVFTFFWISQFFCAMTQYVIASSASHWYFSQGTGQPAKSIILTSLGKALRYHPGSLAWGSLITTLLVPLKMIFCILGPDPYEPKQKKGKFDMLLCKCGCLLSFKRFLATMDDSAYIQMAITGKTFYQSGREAFSLNVRNNHRMKPLRETGYIYTLYAKILFASVATVAALAALTFLDMFSIKIYSPVVTAVLVFVFSYVISSNFTTIYGVAIDTLLMCSIIEDERYRTSNVAIKHCPKALRLLVFRAQRVTKHEKVAEEDGL